ncbi:Estrogen sulfotransferase [Holothuria leucospilota]|uniref:Estrogen sulfotransferase n=1 Tax=Holothuria leucospilota TaxID=206669 RepID=A0A9Q1BRW3_HOLLE|nr:Estrogen sulfotransferase [Holothuria leucospilota]
MSKLPPLHFYKGPTPLPPPVTDEAIDALKTFEYRDGDVLIASYPKCGTHWSNEVVQLILHDGDPTKLDHRHRRACLEIKDVQDFRKLDQVKPTVELVKTDPSPRVLMTHLGPSYLSEDTWKRRIPIVFIFRDPRDVVVSEYNFLKKFLGVDGQPVMKEDSFDEFLEGFISDHVGYGNWCDHALAYEKKATEGENILFVTYEDMKKDLPTVVRSIASHIGQEISDEVVAKVVANSGIEAMKRNYQEASKTQENANLHLSNFVNKGVAGQWKTDFSGDKFTKFNDTFKERVKDSVYAKRYFDE